MNGTKKTSFSDKILKGIEVAGNTLPHPVALFGLFLINHYSVFVYWV